MAEPRDIPDALREAVERTVQATVDTRERAQGAASDLSASVDDLVKGAEEGLTRRRRSVRAAVGERLPATQDDVKAMRAELRRIAQRLDAIEERLPEKPRKGPARAAAKAKPAARGGKSAVKSGAEAKARPAAKTKGGRTRAKPRAPSR